MLFAMRPFVLLFIILISILTNVGCGQTPSLPKKEAELKVTILIRKAKALLENGCYAEAIPLAQEAIKTSKMNLGESHTLTASSLNTLSVLYLDTGEYDQSLKLAQEALEIRKKFFGEKHLHTANSLNNMAELYRTMGY